ncbi:hypothetical protein JCM10908_000797 [Rhodotorula pacifica]|uniref:dihydrofolate synthase n=1 Tax=Rhodotorula pacifica TaxID=1495444 RepID=UPI0031793A67
MTSASDPLTAMSPPIKGISLGLTRIHRLLSLLRSPHHATPVVHIAGTNGKGSVSAYLSSILQHGGGIATGRFNSPHLVDEWDCIHLHGRPVDEGTFREAKRKVEHTSEANQVGATSFEVLTATAFQLFANAIPPVEIAVVEVGMGGSEDATNLVPAEQTLLSVVTAVDLDHQKFLGDTVAQIARVKAGIVRPEGDVVVSAQAHEEARIAIAETARERHARLWQAGEASLVDVGSGERETDSQTSTTALPPAPLASIPLLPGSSSHPLPSTLTTTAVARTLTARLPLPGSYQLQNAATAVLCASLLRSLPRTRHLVPALETRLTDEAIRKGVEATRWPGRLSWISLPATATPTASSDDYDAPLVLLDGAHNPSSARLLASYLSSLPEHLSPSTLIVSISAPRDPADVVRPLLESLLSAPSTSTAGSRLGQKKRRLRVVCCGFSTPVGMDWVRATPPAELASRVSEVASSLSADVDVKVLTATNAEEALALAAAADSTAEEGETTATPRGRRSPIVVAGSLYLVADVMGHVRRIESESGRTVQVP